MSALTDALEIKIGQPKKVQVDGEEVENHSLADIIKALNFLGGEEAKSTGVGSGIRIQKLIPPGTG